MKKIMISLLMLALVMPSFAKEYTQETDSVVYTFNPHWYLRAAFGYQYNIGESGAAAQSAPTAVLGFGYNFTPVWGLRLDVNAWQSADGFNPSKIFKDCVDKSYDWKWYYVAPTLDVTFDLTSAIGGYKHDRICNVGLFAGIGANIHFKNDDVRAIMQQAQNDNPTHAFVKVIDDNADYYWQGCKATVLGQAGVYVDFRLSDHWNLGAELAGNITSDKYNSLKAGNPDWYLNAMVNVRYNFGETSKKKSNDGKKKGDCEPQIVEKIVEKEVEVVKYDTIVEQAKLPLRVEIFFPISSDEVAVTEYTKVQHLVDYLKKYPESKVVITGHADKSTGTKAFNQMISEKRANIVKNELIKKYGISPDRIEAHAMGDTDEPYAAGDPKLNRVSICVAE